MTVIFDGEGEAKKIELQLQSEVKRLGRKLLLVSVVAKEDEQGQVYTRLKSEAAERVGIDFEKIEFSFSDPVEQVAEKIRQACARPEVSGLLVQKPAKKDAELRIKNYELWWRELTQAIDPKKDVDGLTREAKLLPATVRAVLAIIAGIKNYELGIRGQKVAIVGRSELVGKPLAVVLAQRGAQVQLVGSDTVDLGAVTRQADMVVGATGRAGLITGGMVKDGVVAIDVGSPVGDFDPAVKEKASFFTPVPNGVGPMTVVSLLANLVEMGGDSLD